MVRSAFIVGAAAVVLGAGVLACTNESPSAVPTAVCRADLVNGAPAPGDYVGVVRVSADAECSGYLVTNQWAVTARHCISSVLASHPDQITVSFSGTRSAPLQATTVAEVVRSPAGPDLAMLRLAIPLTVGGAPYGFLQRPYPSDSFFAQGTVNCVGWGSTGALNAASDGPTIATLTSDAQSKQPPSLGLDGATYGQQFGEGDAGGLCYIDHGLQMPIGVMAGLFTDGGKDSNVAIDITQPGVRTWMESVVLQHDDDIPATAASIPHAVSSPNGQLVDLFWIDDAGGLNGIEISPDAPPSSNPPSVIIGGSSDDPFAPVRPAAAYSGGNLHIFGRTVSGAVLESVSSGVAPVSTWTPVALLPAIGSGLGIASLDGNRFDLFARSAAGQVAHAWFQNGAWVSNELADGLLDKDILGTWLRDSSNTPLLHLFGVSQTFVLHRIGASDWSSTDVNGNVWSACATVAPSSSTVDLFGRGANGHLVHKSFVGGWVNGFLDLGLAIPDEPSAVIAGARIHIFARNSDGSIWHAHLPR